MKNSTVKKLGMSIAVIGLITACADSHIYKGDLYYQHLAYAKAIPHFEKVYFKKYDKDVGAKLAESYFRTGQISSSEAIYRVILKDEDHSENSLNYAKVLMSSKKYDDAQKVLKTFLPQHDKFEEATSLLSSCRSIDQRFLDPSLYRLDEIETPGIENAFSVTEYHNGIIFVGDELISRNRKKNPWTGTSYLEIFYTQKTEDNDWTIPIPVEYNFNGRFHEGPSSYSEDMQTFYVTRTNYRNEKKMGLTEDLVNNLKIYSSSLENGEWTELIPLPFNSDEYSTGHPSLASSSNELFFISDMPGGFGGTDIYKSKLSNGKWSSPENLGESINTSGNEMFPFIDEDNDKLYFSSDAHNSMGGLDVFMSHYNDNEWSQPENLNFPVNSAKDDFGFIYNETDRKGYVSSSRSSKDRIYEVTNYDPSFNLLGFVHEKGKSVPVEDVTIEIINKETGQIVNSTSGFDGKFKTDLLFNNEYTLKAKKPGFYSETDFISTKGLKYSKDFYAEFEVEFIEVGRTFVLENIFFDFDKWNIRKEASEDLDELVLLLNENPSIEIEMGSHTDIRGTDIYNNILSDKRAESTVNYLIDHGISPDRLRWMGYGEAVLVNDCKWCSEKDHQENRRTTFTVTKVNLERKVVIKE